jgi:hypothetical protein
MRRAPRKSRCCSRRNEPLRAARSGHRRPAPHGSARLVSAIHRPRLACGHRASRPSRAGALADYKHLVMPHNSLYDLGDNAALRKPVKKFVRAGGQVFHGPHCELAGRVFGVKEEAIAFDCINGMRKSFRTAGQRLPSKAARPSANTSSPARPPSRRRKSAKEIVFRSASNTATAIRAAPCRLCRRNMANAKCTPWCCSRKRRWPRWWAGRRSLPMAPVKGVEFARFGKHLVIVNHRSSPVDISGIILPAKLKGQK